MLEDREVEQFWRDGYMIVRDVFSPDEIERFRDVVGELAERLPSPTSTGGAWVLPGDMMAFPELSNVVVEERLVGIAQALLGERPVYFRDSDAVVEGSTRGWHKDNRIPDRYDPTAVDCRAATRSFAWASTARTMCATAAGCRCESARMRRAGRAV